MQAAQWRRRHRSPRHMLERHGGVALLRTAFFCCSSWRHRQPDWPQGTPCCRAGNEQTMGLVRVRQGPADEGVCALRRATKAGQCSSESKAGARMQDIRGGVIDAEEGMLGSARRRKQDGFHRATSAGRSFAREPPVVAACRHAVQRRRARSARHFTYAIVPRGEICGNGRHPTSVDSAIQATVQTAFRLTQD